MVCGDGTLEMDGAMAAFEAAAYAMPPADVPRDVTGEFAEPLVDGIRLEGVGGAVDAIASGARAARVAAVRYLRERDAGDPDAGRRLADELYSLAADVEAAGDALSDELDRAYDGVSDTMDLIRLHQSMAVRELVSSMRDLASEADPRSAEEDPFDPAGADRDSMPGFTGPDRAVLESVLGDLPG